MRRCTVFRDMSLIVATVFLCAAQSSRADEAAAVAPQVQFPARGAVVPAVSVYDPSYFVVGYPGRIGPEGDERHVEFYVSFKTLLLSGDPGVHFSLPNRLYLIYSGLYDFYMFGDRYDSSPLISRSQNPGLLLEWEPALIRDDAVTTDAWQFGYFHHSNGQTLHEAEDALTTAFNLEVQQRDYEAALARVSRGWDYLLVGYEFWRSEGLLRRQAAVWQYWHAEARIFLPRQGFDLAREDDIWWEPVEQQPTIADYDGLRLRHERAFDLTGDGDADLKLQADLRTGVSGLAALGRVSGKLVISYSPGFLPDSPWRNTGWISVFYFNGFGREPSTYHLRSDYVGVGLEIF